MRYGIANKDGTIPNSTEIESILNISKLNNINIIDTAMSYGHSEQALGKNDLSDFKIITKLPKIPEKIGNVHDWVIEKLKNSMNKLNVNKLYCLMLHRPEQLTENDPINLLKTLKYLKDTGLVTKIGISIYSPRNLDYLSQLDEFDIVQCPISVLDRRMIESGWLDLLKAKKIEIHVRSCFLQGLLLMNENELPKNFAKWNPIWQKWNHWQNENNCSALKGCLSFVKNIDNIDNIVVGVDSQKQLKEIIDSYNSSYLYKFPDISSTSENLINPSLWNQ